MSETEEGTNPGPEHDASPSDREAGGGAGEPNDPTQNPAPPGNPETDQEAVDKGEEQLGKVVGR